MSQPSGEHGHEATRHCGPDSGEEFAECFRSSFRTLWLIALGIVGDRMDAEDVVQEAAVVALSKMEQFRPGTNFTAWLSQIIRNVARNKARRERKRRMASLEGNAGRPVDYQRPVGYASALEESSARSDGSSTEQASRTGHRMFDDRVIDALQNVNDVARACLLLRTLEGMEYSRIAALLEIPQGTAMSHVHRARRYLRERLEGYSPEAE